MDLDEFGFGLFDDIPDGVTHPLQIDDFEDDTEWRKNQEANIYVLKREETELHRAIKSGIQAKINKLLEVYRRDFDKVKNHLESKYQWNVDDKIWLPKTILVALGQEQCETAKSLENTLISADDLRRAVFVLLKYPVNGEDLAVIHPNEADRMSVARMIGTSVPNGFLTWNYTGTDGKTETFMEVAASRGLNNVINQLYDLGAPIAIPGHNPLLQACRANKKDTIQLLLTKHFDHFDCTARDSNQHNALIVAIQRNNAKAFDLLLEKMIEYRRKHHNEIESEAFNKLFRFESDESEYLSIFTYIKTKHGPVFQSVEKAIIKYGLDLSYQWKNVTILHCILSRNMALDYCFEGIRNNPQLLGLVTHGTTSILHKLLGWGHIDFIQEMYEKNPQLKSLFNTGSGFGALQKAFTDKNHTTIQFIMEHHAEFLKSDTQKLKDEIVCFKNYSKEYYEERYELFAKYFPEFQTDIEEVRSKAISEKHLFGVERSFANLNVNPSEIDQLPKPFNSIRGSNGETLLHLAVEKDNQELFVRLIDGGCDIDALDNEGNHPVHFVQSEAMLNLIIDRHPEGQNLVHRVNQEGFTVLHKVCSLYLDHQKRIALLERLIELGANVHQLTNNGESVVFFIPSCAVLDLFRKHEIQLDVMDNDGGTALLRHLQSTNTCMARALLNFTHTWPTFRRNAHKYLSAMMYRNRDFFSCDYQDFLEKHPETTKLIFDALYEHSREESSRVFAKACGSAFNFVAEKFLEFDYDLDYNYKNDWEYTPIIGLLSYMEEPNVHIVKRLLEKGVDLHVRNNWGRDALLSLVFRFRSAKWYDHGVDTVQLLLDHGAAINTTDLDGNTPLHFAFAEGEWELVEVLIRNGAELGALNNNGKTPLQMASAVNQELYYFWS